MFVYATEEFKQFAEDYSLVANFYNNLVVEYRNHDHIREQTPPLFESRRFLNRYLKGRTGDYRVVAELVDIEQDQVLYLHTMFIQPSPDYERFIRQINDDIAPFDPDFEQLKAWLQAQKAPKPLPPLPYEYRGWLEKTGDDHSSDLWVYEGSEWVNATKSADFKRRWETYYKVTNAIVSFVDSGLKLVDEEVLIERSSQSDVWLASHDDRYILFTVQQVNIPIAEECQIPRQVAFLLAAYPGNPAPEAVQKVIDENYPFLQKSSGLPLTYDDVARCAARSYPYYLLVEKDLWGETETEVEGVNLALSSEEEKILSRLSNPDYSGDNLPVFINGRAGSGKSTILFYLFANYCEKAVQNGGYHAGNPVFLTYSDELVNVARNRIKGLLKSRLGREVPIDPYVKSFQAFLYSLLNDKTRFRFKPENRVSFHRFKEFYAARIRTSEGMKYSPDFCWYVIRTFIKGYTLDSETLVPKRYDEIDRRERTSIDQRAYTAIYESVWKPYKNYLLEEGQWDDQDLVKAVLKTADQYRQEDKPFPAEAYTAIFCDEAQDFTRLELQFIMQLSVFRKYDLSQINISSLPFAFAGDPLQTLNPTGFRWESTQATFHREIVQALDPKVRLNIQISLLDDLIHNYRSTERIVCLTNTILLWRKILFNYLTQPQECWNPRGKGKFEPKFFLLSDSKENSTSGYRINLADLRAQADQLGNTVFLLPCDEGGELDYIKNEKDLILKTLFPGAEKELPKNIFSAVNAKGLEFRRVILYKFGDRCPEAIWSVDEDTQATEKVQYEYFFNKFYVAATRATSRLYAIDTEQGYINLWGYLHTSENVASLLRKISANDPDALAWKAGICTVAQAEDGDLVDIWEDDPASVAQELKKKGIAGRNPGYLRRAYKYFDSLEIPDEAQECLALALQFENEFLQSGIIFQKLRKYEQAAACFWEGERWQELRAISAHSSEIQATIAELMCGDEKDKRLVTEFASSLIRWLQANALGEPTKQWYSIFREYVRRLMVSQQSTFTKDEWNLFGLSLEQVYEKRLGYFLPDAGQFYFRAENYASAICCFEKSGNDRIREYHMARAALTQYPEKLEHLNRASEFYAVIHDWDERGGLKQSDRRAHDAAITAFVRLRQSWEAVRIQLLLDDDDEEIIGTIEKFYDSPGEINRSGQSAAIDDLFQKRIWEKVRDNVINHLTDSSPRKWKALMEFTLQCLDCLQALKNRDDLRYQVIRKINKHGIDDKDLNEIEGKLWDLIRPLVQMSKAEWSEHLRVSELGMVIELLSLEDALKFYDRFTEGTWQAEIVNEARTRWLNLMSRKAARERQSNPEASERTQKERARRKSIWDSEEKRVPLNKAAIIGLPRSVSITTNAVGIQEFTRDNIRVSISASNKSVQLLHKETLIAVPISLETGSIQSFAVQIVRQGFFPPKMDFEIPEWKLSGTITKQENATTLTLKFSSLTRAIEISIPI